MTNNQPIKNVSLENLEAILEVHGADFARMPVQLAKDIKALIDQSSDAQQMFKQAEFIDRALNQSALARSDGDISSKFDIAALEASIQKTIAQTKMGAEIRNEEDIKNQEIVDLTKWKNNNRSKSKISAQNQSVFQNWKTSLAAPGLIAASLMMGVFFGANGGTTMLLGDNATMTMASNEIADDIFYFDTDFNLGDIAETVN